MISLSPGQIPSEARSAVRRAIFQHMFDPNVSLVDLGLRIRDREGHQIVDEFCVRIHLRRKLYGEAFESFSSRYPERVVRKETIGYAVDLPQASYRPQLWYWWPRQILVPTGPRRRVSNPMRGGISVSSGLLQGYGTLGGKVIDRETGAEMILSNWHVLVGSWYAQPASPIIQPGWGDGGRLEHTVANVTRDAMDEFLDVAVARLNGNRPLVNDQLEVGSVTGASAPTLGARVIKSGRATGVTEGIITGVEGRQVMIYRGVQRVIRSIVHISPISQGSTVSDRGDSGSWWLDKLSRKAVGLHFAGSNQPEYGLAISMPEVLQALNVKIATDDVG